MPDANPADVPRLWQQAASFAARAHNHQYRKDRKTPYIAHPFRVAMVLRDVFGCDDEIAICTALLHDTIEDTNTDFDDIHKRFGLEIAQSVACMTKNMLLIEAEREIDYEKRLIAGPWQARIVKLADVYDNALDLARANLRRKCIHRCERALKLTDKEQHPAFAQARQAVQTLLEALRAKED